VELEHLGLVAVGQPAEFTIRVPEGADAELAVSVQGPVEDIPVKVTGEFERRFRMSSLPLFRFSRGLINYKDSKPYSRLYRCLIEFIDWRVSDHMLFSRQRPCCLRTNFCSTDNFIRRKIRLIEGNDYVVI
jgi:hypothetical protein